MANPFCIGSKGKSQVYSLFCIAFCFLIVVVGAVALYSIPVQDSAEHQVPIDTVAPVVGLDPYDHTYGDIADWAGEQAKANIKNRGK